jgi:hypothetical protein
MAAAIRVQAKPTTKFYLFKSVPSVKEQARFSLVRVIPFRATRAGRY